MENYLNENPEKTIKFFEDEFCEKYGKEPDFGFNIMYPLQSSICCYLAVLTLSKKADFSKVKPNFKDLKSTFIYEFSDFEIKNLKTKTDDELKVLLEKFEVKKDFSFLLGANESMVKGTFCFFFEPVQAAKIEDFKLKFDINLEFEKEPLPEINPPDEVLRRDYDSMSKYFLNAVFDVLKIKNANLKRETINFVPDFFSILSNVMTKEIRKNFPSNTGGFDDLTLEVLDLIIHIYLDKSKDFAGDECTLIITNDDILNLKRAKKAINSKGVRGGYCEKQRLEIDNEIKKLASTELETGKLFFVTAFRKSAQGKGKFHYTLKMGEFIENELKNGDNIKKVPSVLYNYHPKRQVFEKRLGYFLWLGGRRGKNLLVEDLIRFVIKKSKVERPNKVRDGFEEAMDRLCADGVIKSWQYKNFDESVLDKKYWFETWLKQKITIV